MADETLFIKKSSLTQIADAVRTKGGTTEPLAVPDGIVKAIEDIRVGKGSSLPEPYQEVEYIESTGTQWIDTRLSGPNAECVIKLEISQEKNPNGGSYFCGDEYVPNVEQAPKLQQNKDNFEIAYNVGNGYTHFYNYDYNKKSEIVELAYINNTIHLDSYSSVSDPWYMPNDNIHLYVKTRTAHWGPEGYTHRIFYVQPTSQSGVPTSGMSPTSGKIFYLKQWSDKILKRDFIPCYNKNTGEVGLYERVESKFYGNDGTGSFIKGPDV